MSKVELKNIYKIFPEDGFRAVDNVTITIEDKEFVVLVGPSGCGKSTTLRMIAGLEDISSGELLIDGELMNYREPRDRNISMVFQNYALYPHMTVYENMAFGLKIKKIPQEEIAKRVKEAARILDIEQYLDRRPKALSGGQRQRVAVGRAIVRQPKVFLFDEPLSNLDAKLRVQMRAEIIALHKRLAATIVYVTHDQVEAMTMGDKIVVMKGGIVQQIGAPLHVYHNPINRFVASFIGSPPMNFIKRRVEDRGGILYAGNIRVADEHVPALRAAVGREIEVGIRPEDFIIAGEGEDTEMSGTVAMIEPLGGENNLHIDADDSGIHFVATLGAGDSGIRFIATLGADESGFLHVGQKACLGIKKNHLKYFDAETGNAFL